MIESYVRSTEHRGCSLYKLCSNVVDVYKPRVRTLTTLAKRAALQHGCIVTASIVSPMLFAWYFDFNAVTYGKLEEPAGSRIEHYFKDGDDLYYRCAHERPPRSYGESLRKNLKAEFVRVEKGLSPMAGCLDITALGFIPKVW